MEPQCQFYVVRKKRLCRMTVRPGMQYCGEHNPMPEDDLGQDDSRIPCPNDPKHTCYVRRLEKHLSICNAHPQDDPDYIVRNVNSPPDNGVCPRRPLNEYPTSQVQHVMDKINSLYNELVEGNIDSVPELPIHKAVVEEFTTAGRMESSLRHLRQASSILHQVEAEGLVQDDTCYVELGAGKGQLSVFAATAWCDADGSGSSVLLVERAALRHKRDNRLRPGAAHRLRADLAHLVLTRTQAVRDHRTAVALAKHLCGVATDYALRCVAGEASTKTAGLVMATCCHHRCELAAYVGELQELGISSEEFNIMLGLVSWATCGHGRSRQHRARPDDTDRSTDHNVSDNNRDHERIPTTEVELQETKVKHSIGLDLKVREEVGRRAKALIDWGRVLYLRRRGYHARLCHFVPRDVSLENVCIIASKP